MADGFTVQIDDELARKVERAATAVGMTREEYVRFMLEQQTFDVNDYTWLNGDPRAPRSSDAFNEPTRPWEDIRAEAIALLEEKLRGRD
jgi:hypothetical protein